MPMHEVRRIRANPPARELLIAAEVLSPSRIRYGLGKNRERYQRWIPEYWIVDLDARRFERRRRGSDQPELIVETREWRPGDERSVRARSAVVAKQLSTLLRF